jgi:galactan 5-O-arabinofuranosyltransferase
VSDVPRRRWIGPALEAAVALGTAGLFVASSMLVRVNPRDRLGQISGLAGLEYRFFGFGLALVIALIIASRVRGGRGFAMTSRLVCASIAGLASAIVAGGIMVALRGTPWGLLSEDTAAIARWATALQRGGSPPALYPPLSLHVLALYSDAVDLPAAHAIKHLQIAGTAAFGPVAYLSWRLLLRPVWALAIGVVAMIPLIDQYKPYPNLVLVAFVPIAILFLTSLRDRSDRHWFPIGRAGVGFGAAFGVMCLLYSGWFQWAAPGLFIATLVMFPWKTAKRGALILLGVTGAVFLMFTWHYVAGLLLDPAAKILDDYVYFDVKAEPMYIAMWRNDLPGEVGTWPPIGELGGVGLFTLILITGLGLAIALGRKTTVVITIGCVMAGAWLMRFFYARMMWETKLVQLYPRTTALILYSLLILSGFAVHWLVRRLPSDSPLRSSSAMIGAACALLLVFASMGSATADRFMPANTDPVGAGRLAFNAHQAQKDTRAKVYKSLPLRWIRRGIVPPAP